MLGAAAAGQAVAADHRADRLQVEQSALRVGADLFRTERGHLQVPENRARSDSRLIELAFVRLLDPAGPEAAPVIYLAGGPGQPILKDIEQFGAAYAAYLGIGGRGDLVLVEPRGVGRSRPALDCPGSLDHPLDAALTAERMAAAHDRHVARCIAHWTAQGVDLAGYTVEAMAADVEELRQALGYRKVKLFGESFGAQHALAMLGADDRAIERVALSAVLGPDDMFELPLAIDRQLAALAELARADPALAGEVGDLSALMRRVLDRLDPPRAVRLLQPGGVYATVLVGRYDLQLATVTLLRNTSFLARLPQLYQAMDGGDFGWLARWSARVRRGQSLNLMSLAVTCAAGASAERRALIAAQAAASPFGPAVDLLGAHACDRFPAAGTNGAPAPVKSAVPVLLISAGLDPRAPPANAEQLLPSLAQGQHIVLPGVSHDFGDARDAQLELAYRFLADGSTTQRRKLPAFAFAPLERRAPP